MTAEEEIAYNNGIIIGMASKGIIKASNNDLRYPIFNKIERTIEINSYALQESTNWE